MAYTQFGYPCPTVPTTLPSSQMLLPASGSPQTTTPVAAAPATSCCESGRPIMTDPNTGQTVCSCQYGSPGLTLPYPRVGLTESVYSSAYAAQGYMPFGTDPSAFYSPLLFLPNPLKPGVKSRMKMSQWLEQRRQAMLQQMSAMLHQHLRDQQFYCLLQNGAYELKESSDTWRSLAHPTPCYPYDPTMGAGYPYGQSALAQRKNATREATSTLKAWLQEHIKNPYPTKGEKIMLAIITKMTLTQVSTWFANARRRLKKENKMTWSPRNRTDEDGNKIDSDDEDDKNDDEKSGADSKCKDDDDDVIDAGGRDSAPLNICVDDGVSDILSDGRTDSDKKDEERFSSCGVRGGILPPTQALPPSPMSVMSTTNPTTGSCMSPGETNSQKPRIWSLADVATSSNPPDDARGGPPPINPKLNGLDSPSAYSPVSSFRPWVNGVNSHSYPHQHHQGLPSHVMPPTNPSGPPQGGAPNNTPSGLLRPYSLAARPEVH